MASHWFNHAKNLMMKTLNMETDDIRSALLMTNTDADTANDGVQNLSGLTLDEMDGANYARKAHANQAVATDDANDRSEYDHDDNVWSALGNGARAVQGELVYKHVDGTAANDIPIYWREFAVNQNPGGSDFTVANDAEGAAHLS